MKKYFIPVLFVFALLCCTKDRLDNIQYFKDHTNTIDTTGGTTGTVLINEFMANGSTLNNEYGQPVDWIELYNTGDSAVNFSLTNYYITDDTSQKDKFKIDGLSIPGKGYMVVFCDDSAQITSQQVHTNFGLSKNGEFVALYKKNGAGDFVPVTEHEFGSQNIGISEGRYPDAGTTWANFSVPTPGVKNEL